MSSDSEGDEIYNEIFLKKKKTKVPSTMKRKREKIEKSNEDDEDYIDSETEKNDSTGNPVNLKQNVEKVMGAIRTVVSLLPEIEKDEEETSLKSKMDRYAQAQSQKEAEVASRYPNKFDDVMKQILGNEQAAVASESTVLGSKNSNQNSNNIDDSHIVRMGSGITQELRFQETNNVNNTVSPEDFKKGEKWVNVQKRSGKQAISLYNYRAQNTQAFHDSGKISGNSTSVRVSNAAISKIHEFLSRRGKIDDNMFHGWKEDRFSSKQNKKTNEEVNEISKDEAEVEGIADEIPSLGGSDNIDTNKKKYGMDINILYAHLLSSLDPYWDLLRELNHDMKDKNILDTKIEPPIIDPKFVPLFLTPAYGPVPSCILGTDCFLNTTMVHKDTNTPHIGSTFLFPDQLRLLREGKIGKIAPGTCYYCLCIIIGILLQKVSANGDQPHPIKPRRDGNKDIFGMEDEETVRYETDMKNVEEQNEFRFYEGIMFPFQHPVAKPGGYRLEFVHHQATGYTGEIVVPFRKVTTHQFESATIEVKWRNKPDDPLNVKKLPTYIEKSDLFFRHSSRDYDPHCIDPFIGMHYDVKPLTTESLLRNLFKDKSTVESAIRGLGGSLDYVFPNIYKVTKQTRQRGIAIRSHENVKEQDAWELKRKEQQKAKFDGKPFDFIFTEDIEKTQSNIKELLTAFNFLRPFNHEHSKKSTEGWVIEYPYFRMHNEEILPEADLCNHSRYHTLHLRLNIAWYLIEQESKFRKERENVIQKLFHFIEGHYCLVEHFTQAITTFDAFYLDDSTFNKIPENRTTYIDDIQHIKMEVPEFRTYGELTSHKSKCVLVIEDFKFVEYKATKILRDSPHSYFRRFLRSDIGIKFIEKSILKKLSLIINIPLKQLCDHYLFHEFRSTVELIKHLSIRDPSQCKDMWNLLNWCDRWCPFKSKIQSILKQNISLFHIECSIFAALLLRVNIAEIVYKELEEYLPIQNEVMYMLHLYSQTHLNLASHISNTMEYKNILLERELNVENLNYDKAKPTFYMLYYPGQYDVECEGTLEDMSHLCSYITFISFNDIGFGVWHYLMGKLLPKCCQKRTVSRKQDEACTDNEDYYRHVCQCFVMSLMGLYRTSKNRPKFERRLAIHSHMNEYHNKGEFMDFMISNKYIVSSIIREHLMFQMCADIAYTIVVSLYFPRWGVFLETSQDAVDLIRKIFDETGEFTGIEKKLEEKIGNTEYVFRRNSNDFVAFILGRFKDMNKSMDAIIKLQLDEEAANELNGNSDTRSKSSSNNNNNNYSHSSKTKHQQKKKMKADQDNLGELLITNLAATIKTLSVPKRKQIDKYVENLVPCDDIYLSDLEIIGVSEAGINRLEECYLIYKQEESKKRTTQNLSMLSATDYEIIYYFFWALRTHYSLRLVHLTRDMTARQLEAARRKFNVPQEEEVTPYEIRSILFSACCCKIKTFNAQSHHISFMGAERIVKNDITNKLYCGKKPTKKQAKPLESKKNTNTTVNLSITQYNKKLLIEKKKKEREDQGFVFGTLSKDYKNRYRRVCIETPIRIAPAAGFAVEFKDSKEKRDQKSYTICPRCGFPTHFSISMYGPNGFSCMKCDQDFRTQLNQPMCTGCHTIKSTREDNSDRWKTLYFLDDRLDGSQMFQEFHFCNTCAKKSISRVHNNFLTRREIENLISREIRTGSDLEMELFESWNIPNADIAALRS